MRRKLDWVEDVELKSANCDISFNNGHVDEDEKRTSPQNGQTSEEALTRVVVERSSRSRRVTPMKKRGDGTRHI